MPAYSSPAAGGTSEPFQPGARASVTDRVEEPQGGSQLSAPLMDEGVRYREAQRSRRLFCSRGENPWTGLLGSLSRASAPHSWGPEERNIPGRLLKAPKGAESSHSLDIMGIRVFPVALLLLCLTSESLQGGEGGLLGRVWDVIGAEI